MSEATSTEGIKKSEETLSRASSAVFTCFQKIIRDWKNRMDLLYLQKHMVLVTSLVAGVRSPLLGVSVSLLAFGVFKI